MIVNELINMLNNLPTYQKEKDIAIMSLDGHFYMPTKFKGFSEPVLKIIVDNYNFPWTIKNLENDIPKNFKERIKLAWKIIRNR